MLESIINNIPQFIINIIELLIWLFIISIFLYFKQEYKKRIFYFLFIYMVLYVVERIFTQFIILNIIISIYSTFFIYFLYKGRFIYKFFTFWISHCINYVINMIIISIAGIRYDGNLFFNSIQEINSKSIVTLIKLLLFILIYIIYKKCVPINKLKINVMSNAQTLLLTILGYITMIAFEYGVRTYIKVPINENIFIMITYLATIIYNVVVLILIGKLVLNKKYKLMNDISQSQLLTQFKHYESLKEKMEQTRKLKHDMNNHVMCIEALIENNEIEKAKGILDNIKYIMHESDLEISSGNSIVDAILNEKNKYAQSYGINFSFEGALPQECNINPIDISTIFSNALDNAIEAAQQDINNNRFIKTTIKLQGKCILILIENSTKQHIKITDNNIETTKNNKGQHGFGLKNIRESVEKYGGDFNISCIDKIFSLEILFNIDI